MSKGLKRGLVVLVLLLMLIGGGFLWLRNGAAREIGVEKVSAQSTNGGSVAVGTVQSDASADHELTKAFGEVTKSLFSAIGYGFIEVTSGITFEDVGDGQQIVRVNGQDNLLSFAGNAFAYVSTLPISGVKQTSDTLEVIGLKPVQEVNAQGYGYSSLEPLMSAWRIFRNVAYVCFTVIILAVGIMILFQQKFDGSLVLTIQKAIPNIILSLVLVTFSYAIVGFMIDAMYLLMFLFGGLFAGTNGLDTNALMDNSIFGLGGTMLGGGIQSTWQIFSKLVIANSTDDLLKIGGGQGAEGLERAGALVSFIFKDIILGFLIGGVLTIILTVVIIIVVLINIWKLFVTLLKSYVLIILNTLFAPILLLLGAFPNTQSIKRWFNAIIGNLSAFVAVFVIIVIYFFIKDLANTTTISWNGASGQSVGMAALSGSVGDGGGGLVESVAAQNSGTGAGGAGLFIPPYIIGTGMANPSGVAIAVLGLGIILVLPELVEKVRKKMGAESGFLGEMAGIAKDKLQQGAKTGVPIVAGTATGIAAGLTKNPQGNTFFQELGVTQGGIRGMAEAFMGGRNAQKEGKLGPAIKMTQPITDQSEGIAMPLYTKERAEWRQQQTVLKRKLDVLTSALGAASASGDPVAIGQIRSQMAPIEGWQAKYGPSAANGFQQWLRAGKPTT